MQRKSMILCGFAVVMGIFEAFLRWLQNLNAFEPDTGLGISGSPWNYTVAAIALLFAVLLLIWVKKYKNAGFETQYPEVYSKSIFFISAVSYVIGAAILFGGILTLFRAVRTSKSVFDLILGLFSLVCAAGMTSFVKSTHKPEKGKRCGVFGAVSVVFFLCFWLIASYKYSASDPVIWHFAPRLLAISSTILAFYFMAGFVFNKPRPISSLYFGLLGTFMCIGVLSDSYPAGEQLITFGFACAMTVLSFSQLNGAKPED